MAARLPCWLMSREAPKVGPLRSTDKFDALMLSISASLKQAKKNVAQKCCVGSNFKKELLSQRDRAT